MSEKKREGAKLAGKFLFFLSTDFRPAGFFESRRSSFFKHRTFYPFKFSAFNLFSTCLNLILTDSVSVPIRSADFSKVDKA
ncbi:MAG: hypothetical protein BWK80_11050 [Desulfobacteraceae bacterium IS3]|nr:MAG: hypothetical protein BWK80_11050 [Desulfobacteraceae bacterium IS3]